MSTKTVSERVQIAFGSFVRDTSSEQMRFYNHSREPTTLAEYIHAWMEYDDGAYDCLGDYSTYLIGVIAIIDEWTREPDQLNYLSPGSTDPDGDVKRQVSSIFGDGVDHIEDILDRDFFARARLEALHPRPPGPSTELQ